MVHEGATLRGRRCVGQGANDRVCCSPLHTQQQQQRVHSCESGSTVWLKPQSLTMLHFLLFRGDFGRLGHGDCGDVFLPKPISGLNDINIVACACGDTHSLCVSSDGALYAFGRNSNGQLGNGTSEDSTMPQRVAALQVGSSSVLRELVCAPPTGSCEAARVAT